MKERKKERKKERYRIKEVRSKRKYKEKQK